MGPFNVDRAPTGQFVSKGSIKNPIERFPSSEEKINLEEGGKQRKQQRGRKLSFEEEGESEEERQQRRSSKQRRSGKEKEGELVTNSGEEDLRKYGPFNVDRAPTG